MLNSNTRDFSKFYHRMRFSVCYFFLAFGIFAESNPWNRLPTTRVLSRKEVSHIVLESRTNHYRVTLIVSDRFPYNYKVNSFPFFFRIDSEKEALDLAAKMDQYLDTGKSFTITLNGSEIESILWGEP